MLKLQDIQTQIRQVTSTIGRAHLVGVSIFTTIWLLAIARSRIASLSTAEVEYIAAGSCCTQVLWMKQMLCDYDFVQGKLFIFRDNQSAINISKNLVEHSRTKHIEIHHHFIRDLVEDDILALEHIPTDKQLADIFTKALDSNRFEQLWKSIGVCSVEN